MGIEWRFFFLSNESCEDGSGERDLPTLSLEEIQVGLQSFSSIPLMISSGKDKEEREVFDYCS